MAHAAHEMHDAQGHHISSLPLYLKVFGALLVLTAITVGVSYLGLPQPLSLIVAIGLAAIKATLVATFFMHLKYDDKFHTLVLLGSLVFLALFFMFTLLDLGTRDALLQDEQNFSFEKADYWHQKMADEAAPAGPALAPDPNDYLKQDN